MPNITNDSVASANVRSTVDYFISLQESDGNIYEGLPGRKQWCHGAPGSIAIFMQAYLAFGDQKYLVAAQKAANYTAHNGIIDKGMQLGHGVAGNTYMVMQVYAATKDPVWLSKGLSMLLAALHTPQLTDPVQMTSYDCVASTIFCSTQGGMLSLFVDMLKNQQSLDKISMPAYGPSW